jgi:hypothetical protein
MTQKPLSPEISSRLEILRAMPDQQVALVATVLRAHDNRIAIDLLAAAAVQRSLALIDGFCALIERQNCLCAAPLVRLQLDSAMHVFAALLVNDPSTVLRQHLAERQLNRIKDRDGEKLTDKYLHETLAKRVPWVSAVYNATSGFVHMSKRHLMDMVQAVGRDGRISFCVGRANILCSPGETSIVVDAFTGATRLLTWIIEDWLKTKTAGSTSTSTCSTA